MPRRLLIALVAAASLLIASPANAAQLVLAATGPGTVRLAPSGALRQCGGSTCVFDFPTGTNVTLTAFPTIPGASLARWLRGCTGTAPVCRLTLRTSMSVTARFTPVELRLDRQAGRGTVVSNVAGIPCGGACIRYPYATRVTLTANPAPDWIFRSWNDACSGFSGPVCTLALFADAATGANFDCAPDQETCSVEQPVVDALQTTISVIGTGSVTVGGTFCDSRCAYGRRVCRTTCRWPMHRFTTIGVSAAPIARFRGWSGPCSGRGACTFPSRKSAAGRLPAVTATFG